MAGRITGRLGVVCEIETFLPIRARGIRHHTNPFPLLAPDPKFWGWAGAGTARRQRAPPLAALGTKGLGGGFKWLSSGNAEAMAPSAVRAGERKAAVAELHAGAGKGSSSKE